MKKLIAREGLITSVLLIALFPSVGLAWDLGFGPSEKQREWKMYKGPFRSMVEHDNSTCSANVTAVEDGYKMIRSYTNKEMVINGTKIPASKGVEWGWKLRLRNNTAGRIQVLINYILYDKDGFNVTSNSSNIEYLAAGETDTIQNSANMPYESMERIVNSKWEIKDWSA